MKTVYLISCVSEKRESERPAEEIYCSDWFNKARAYVVQNLKPEDEWYILSAKYGLLNPCTVIGPYNETLNKMRKLKRMEWARRVEDELRKLLHSGDSVVLLAGQRYREFLQSSLLELGCQVSIPMRGLGIGKQLSWLANAVRR